MGASLNKREALLRYLEADRGEGYTPAAFFLHFGEGFRSGAAAIQKHREFFEFTGMDFVKIQFELDFPKVEIPVSIDYHGVPFLPVSFYEPQIEVVKGLLEAFKSEALVVVTLYSPFMILGQMVGQRTLVEHMEEAPEHVFKGLEVITESLLGFVHECVRVGLDGFYHSTQGGESGRFTKPDTFLKFVKPTDHRVMNEIDESCDFNILHICDYHQEFGGYDDLTPFLDYPGQVVNVSTEIGGKSVSPSELSQLFGRPYMGGMDRKGPLATGTVDEARASARQVLHGAPPKFILGADCTAPASTPWENLRAAVSEAHGVIA